MNGNSADVTVKSERAIYSLIFVASFAIFLSSPAIRVSDAKYTLLLSEHIVEHGNFQLDRYFWPNLAPQEDGSAEPKAELPRHIKERGGHLYYIYPYGSSILSAPFAMAYGALGISTIDSRGNYRLDVEKRMQKFLASFLMAVACVVFYALSRTLLTRPPSILVTVAAGFGTQVWSTAATGLWTHTWNIVLLSFACLLALRAEKEHKIQPVLLATLLSWGFFVRPTAALYIVPFALWMGLRFRSRCVPFLCTGMFWLGSFLLYSFIQLDGLPHYYTRSPWSFSTFPIGLYGQLLSPSRGLLVYVPSLLVVAYLLASNWEKLKFKTLVNASILALTLHTLVMASQRMWWGGASYGPRLYTDLVPLFVLLGSIGIEATQRRQRGPHPNLRVWPHTRIGKIRVLAATASVVIAIVLNGTGALSPRRSNWSGEIYGARYRNPDPFDWTRPQFMCVYSPHTFCPKANGDQMSQEFRSLDANDDRSIEKDEYRANGFLRFREIDRNEDRGISLKEWRKIYE